MTGGDLYSQTVTVEVTCQSVLCIAGVIRFYSTQYNHATVAQILDKSSKLGLGIVMRSATWQCARRLKYTPGDSKALTYTLVSKLRVRIVCFHSSVTEHDLAVKNEPTLPQLKEMYMKSKECPRSKSFLWESEMRNSIFAFAESVIVTHIRRYSFRVPALSYMGPCFQRLTTA